MALDDPGSSDEDLSCIEFLLVVRSGRSCPTESIVG
jgi:hypothetical protein